MCSFSELGRAQPQLVFIYVVVLIFYVIVFLTGIHLKVVFISFLFEVILFFLALLINQPRLRLKADH